MNRLADETSPYLQQHADNPVDWYPWGEDALNKAREENKPILLSIGYSACRRRTVAKRGKNANVLSHDTEHVRKWRRERDSNPR